MLNAMKRPVTARERTRVMLRVFTALHEVAAGRGTRDEWSDLADCLNMVEALANLRKCDLAVVGPLVETAQAGMVQAMDSLKATGRMHMPEEACRSCGALASQYESAMERLSAQSICDATRLVLRSIAGYRSNPECTVEVVEA